MGIMEGFDDVVDKALGINGIGERSPHYGNMSSALALTIRPSGFDAAGMIREAFEVLHGNHDKAPRFAEKGPSPENWRWEKKTEISVRNNSPEKRLEKTIAKMSNPAWVNQIPTASGLWDKRADQHRDVDLAHFVDRGVYELIELKVGSDNPLKAAIEVVQYGLLYLLARKLYRPERLIESPLLGAREIRLRVLAPEAYYSRVRLGWLSMDLDKAIRSLAAQVLSGFTMNFAFDAFPCWFSWPCADNDCLRALDERKRCW